MRLLRYLFFGIAAVVLQTTLVPTVGVFEQRPDLIVIFAVIAGSLEGPRWGATAGFLAGLAVDVYHPPTFGAGAMGGAVAGYLGGKTRVFLDLESPVNQAAAFFAAHLGHDGVYALVVAVKAEGNFWEMFILHGIGSGIYSALGGVLVFAVLQAAARGRGGLDLR
ncbi:MAG: rod shape-determining protein MreD [bacterium]